MTCSRSCWTWHAVVEIYRVGQKECGTLLLFISSLIIDQFSKFFTGTLCRQFAIRCLLHIPPQSKCVSTLPYEISTKYALITIITNTHFSKMEKKHFRPTLQWMVCMTLDCVGITQSSVIRIIHCNVGLKCFNLLTFLLLSIVIAYIYISQGSVKTH